MQLWVSATEPSTLDRLVVAKFKLFLSVQVPKLVRLMESWVCPDRLQSHLYAVSKGSKSLKKRWQVMCSSFFTEDYGAEKSQLLWSDYKYYVLEKVFRLYIIMQALMYLYLFYYIIKTALQDKFNLSSHMLTSKIFKKSSSFSIILPYVNMEDFYRYIFFLFTYMS